MLRLGNINIFLLNLISNYCQYLPKNIHHMPYKKQRKEKKRKLVEKVYNPVYRDYSNTSWSIFGTCMLRCLLNDVPWCNVWQIYFFMWYVYMKLVIFCALYTICSIIGGKTFNVAIIPLNFLSLKKKTIKR